MTRAVIVVLALLAPAAAEAQYRHPSACQDGCMTVSAYRDHGGHVDWNCGSNTYSGHGGTDFAIYGGYAAVDEGREVVAAAEGVVVQANDGEFDRCSTGACSGGGGFGNYVAIQHADGVITFYGHQRQGSIAVGVGDHVGCGQHLGFIASSGSSTGPHLHFEPRAGGGGFEPFGGGGCSDPGSRWIAQGPYGGLPGTSCPITDRPPEGWLDAAACDGIRGWARDPDAPDAQIDVVLAFDAPLFQPGSSALRTPASVHRDDVGDHGFWTYAPYGLMDGADHAVFAYGGGAAGGGAGPLSGTPATLHCDRAAPPFPSGVRRHVTDPDSYAAWQFSTLDVVHIDDVLLATFPESDPWPAAPALFAPAGDPAVYLRDVRNGGPARRHVPSPEAMSAWRLDWGAIAAVDLAARDALAGDVEISTRPYLVQGSGPAIYVIDAAPPALPSPDGGVSTSDGGTTSGRDAGLAAHGDGAIAHADGSIGAPRPSASGCSIGHAGAPSAGLWAALAVLAIASRRRPIRT